MSSNSKKTTTTTTTTTTKTKSKTSSAADDVVVDATNKRTTMTTMCSLLQQQINHSSIQDLSFGDFTQDELNTYLINKKLNNTNKATNQSNQITEANESKVDNNKSDSQQNQHPTCKNREKEEDEEETTRSSREPINQSINSPPPSEFDIEFGFDLNPSVLLSESNKVGGEKSDTKAAPTSHRSSDATRPVSSSISSLSSSLSSSDDSSTSIRDNNEYSHRVSKQQQQQQTVTANSISSVKNLRAAVDLTTKTESRAAESSLSSSPPISSHSSTYSSSSPPPSSPPHSSTSSYSSSSPFSVPNATNTSSSKMETVESTKSMENQTVGSISNNNNNNASQNEQRRNKKKKPPNYYQSAEYAAIIKLNAEAAAAAAAEENSTTTTNSSNKNHNDTASNTQETAGNISSTSNHYNSITTESSSKSDKQQSDSETSTKSEEPPTTNGDNKSQSVNEAEKAVTEAAKKLDKVDLNNESGSTSSDEQQKTEQATNTPTTTSAPSSKPSAWSSLFKSSATTATSQQQQQTNSSKQNGQKPATPKTPTISSSSSTNLNGTGTSSSAASVSGDSEQDKTFVANLDVLKNLGTLLKQCELKHSAPALQPRGLSNRNNWCYVNATLQALLACPPFYNLLKTVYTKLKSANSSSLAMQHVPFVAALGRFISEFKVMVRSASSTSSQSEQQVVKNSSKELVIGEPFECEYFYDVLSKSQSHMEFRPGRQEDAQEFLSFLLNRLHEEMVKCLESLNPPKQQPSQPQHTSLDYTKTNGKSNGYGEANSAAVNGGEIQEDDDWHEVGRKNRAFVTRKPEFKQSPLSDIFCGQFRSALSQPGVKDKDSVSLEPFFTLPLEIQSDSIRTVQQALEHFVQKEELSGFKHQETKQEIEAFKRISFEDLPPVLIIYLKCFVFDKHGGSQKLLKRLEFAIDLEISRELISPAQRSKLKDKKRSSYKLFAVEYHHGERATGGHYITDVYHPGIVAWVRYDDAHVRVLNNAQVLKSDDRKLIPYLLYYRRCDLI